MRDSVKLASLGELMGEGFEHRDKLTLEDLPKLLGEKMPHIPYDRVGRIRLVNALQQRFGPGFKNIPGIANLLKDFDEEMHVHSTVKINHHANQLRKAVKDSEHAKKMADGGMAKKKNEEDDDVLDTVVSTFKNAFSDVGDYDKPKKNPTPVKNLPYKQATDYSSVYNRATGGKIPGRAEMQGDHKANDKVHALLSPGEIVIPRSIVMGPNAPERAAEFVRKELKKNRG